MLQGLLEKSEKTVDKVSLSALLATLQSVNAKELSSVSVLKSGIVMKKRSTQTITCKIKSIVVNERTPVVFEPEVSELLPEGIILHSSLIYLRKGNNTRVSVTVVNESERDVTLYGRLQLGELHQVNSVTPVQIQEVNELPGESCKVQVGSTEVKTEESKVPAVSDEERNKQEKEERENMNLYWEQIEKMDMSMLTTEQKNAARKMLWEERDAFSVDANDIGDAEDLCMDLKTSDDAPVQHRYNNIPQHLMSEVKNHVEDLLNRQWITKSKSAWASPMVLVRKKDGTLRLCCDFRRLNKKTTSDKHPLPRVQASLDSLGGSSGFSVLDQSRAYYQGYISEGDRHKTAFVTPWGLYQWVRIPFGLTNAPATFQRFMEETVGEFRDKFAIPYLDDVIVYSKSFDEHLGHLSSMLRRIREKGLKLNISKCKFFKSSVKFIGRIVDKDGYRMDRSTIDAVTALRRFVPTNVNY